MTEPKIDTHNLIVEFGKHRGLAWTRVPVSYLKWLVNTPKSRGQSSLAARVAQAELDRRGISLTQPEIEISAHAIDRASLNCRHIWHQTALSKQEGLHAWLWRIASEALVDAADEKPTEIFIHGLKLCFEYGELYPILKTVMPAKEPQ